MNIQEIKTSLSLSALTLIEQAHADKMKATDKLDEAYFRGLAEGTLIYLREVRMWLNQLEV